MGYKDEDFILRQAKQMGEALGNILGQEAADEIMMVEAEQGQKKSDEILFRKTIPTDVPAIMLLIQDATAYLKEQGSPQWQNNQAPTEETIQNDIKNDVSYVLTLNHEVVGLCALIAEKDSAYEAIDGAWNDLGTDTYVAIHRVAVSSNYRGLGLGQKLLEEAIKKAQSLGYQDIRIDTYPTNGPMLHLIDKVGFTYQGMIEFDFINGERKAFQLI